MLMVMVMLIDMNMELIFCLAVKTVHHVNNISHHLLMAACHLHGFMTLQGCSTYRQIM